MSQSQQFPVSDSYLASPRGGLWLPENDITVDPQYGSVRMLTPIGRLAFANLTRPKSVKQGDGKMGEPIFSATILLNPNACGDIYQAIVAVATNRFPPELKPDPANPNVMKEYSAEELLFVPPARGGLHYPLRAGSENYMRDPGRYEQWRELFFLNTSMKAVDTKGNQQSPVFFDDGGLCNPEKFYSGCYVVFQVTFQSYPKPGQPSRGSRGVGVFLNAVRFVRHGEKLGSFDAVKSASEAFARGGAIPSEEPSQVGYGPNSGTPGSVPPGVAVPANVVSLQQPQIPAGHIPPQQPRPTYIPAGARPPG